MGQIKNIKLHIVTDIKDTNIRMMDSTQQSKPLPSIVTDAVLIESAAMPDDAVTVEGYDFNQGIHYDKLLASMKRTGFQALHFGQAVEEINLMLQCRDQPLGEINEYIDEKFKPRSNCTIFLGYTSNMASAGVRDVIRFLVEHKLVDVLVSTAGGIKYHSNILLHLRHPQLHRSRDQLLRNPSLELPNPLLLQRTLLLPYPLRHTSGRMPA